MLECQRNWRIWNPPNLIESLFIQLIWVAKNTQVSNFSNVPFWPTPLPLLSNTPSITLLIRCSLAFSHSSINSPTLFLPVVFAHKYYADFMRRYHCNKLIESKYLFHLGDSSQYSSVWVKNARLRNFFNFLVVNGISAPNYSFMAVKSSKSCKNWLNAFKRCKISKVMVCFMFLRILTVLHSFLPMCIALCQLLRLLTSFKFFTALLIAFSNFYSHKSWLLQP
jgi:hypothetical protein